MTRLLIFLVIAIGSACQSSNPFNCPRPELVKLRKAKAHHMKYAVAKRKEALADQNDYFRESDFKAKSLSSLESWDCPKPGLKHDKMVQKKARDLQRRYAKNLKKVARESEERTVTVNNLPGTQE